MKLRKKQKCAAAVLVCCILFQTTYYCVVRPNVVYATGAIGSAAAGAAGGAAFLTGPETALIIAGLFGVTYTIEHADDLCKTMKAAGNAAVSAAGAAAGVATDAVAVVEDWWKAASAGVVDTTSSVWDGICSWFTDSRTTYNTVNSLTTARAVKCVEESELYYLNYRRGTSKCKVCNIGSADNVYMVEFYYKYGGYYYAISRIWLSDSAYPYVKYYDSTFTQNKYFDYDAATGLYWCADGTIASVDECKNIVNKFIPNAYYLGEYENAFTYPQLLNIFAPLVQNYNTLANSISGGIDKALDVTNIDDINFPDTIALSRQAIDELADSVADSVAKAIDNLATGAWTWTEYLEKIASGTQVGAKTAEGLYVLDDAGITTIPLDRTKEDSKADSDVDSAGMKDSLSDYKTDGLTSLFPFCIPFDLINCIKLMSATGEAPCWEFPFKVPVLGLQENIKIDLAKWDSVAAVCRWGETLIFIGFLISKTRTLIRG